MKKLTLEITIPLTCGLLAGIAFYLALELDEAKQEARNAISELTEIRVQREWERGAE